MTADQWFDQYGESHQNPTNKLIHWICIPIIFFTVVGLLWSIPVPAVLSAVFSESPWANFATLSMILVFGFYLRLSIPLGLGYMLLNLFLAYAIAASGTSLALVSIVLFVLAWIGQFYGHKVEGKKPSFFKDLQFLLIGPLWLMHFIYKKVGIAY